MALRSYGNQASAALEPLFEALTHAVVECDYSTMRALCDSIAAVAADADEQIQTYFAEQDREVRTLALQIYREQQDNESQ
jgi:hypothetical protein